MKNCTLVLFLGIWIGFVILFMLIKYTDNDLTQYRVIKTECEKTLPRNQECKLVGVPIK